MGSVTVTASRELFPAVPGVVTGAKVDFVGAKNSDANNMDNELLCKLTRLLENNRSNVVAIECLRLLESKNYISIEAPESLETSHINMIYQRRFKHYLSLDRENKKHIVGFEQLIDGLKKHRESKVVILNVKASEFVFLIMLTLSWDLIGIIKSATTNAIDMRELP